jgi:hypothetical protein
VQYFKISREYARELEAKGNSYYGLFAADKEDWSVIAYREIKRWDR